MSKLTRAQFFETLSPYVIFVRKQGSVIFPSLRLAQSLLETGGVIRDWNNLGGIKEGSGRLTPYWRGDSVTRDTWEYRDSRAVREKADFRAYRTLYHYFKDQDELFKLIRYTRVIYAATPQQQAEELYLAGYATDPSYASKLKAMIEQYQLEVYDAAATTYRKPAAGFEEAQLIPVIRDNKLYAEGYLENGTSYVPVRKFSEGFGAKVDWREGNVMVNDVVVASRLVEGVSYARPRELMTILPFQLEWDANAKVLFIL